MTTESFKMKKLIEARSQCPEYKSADLYWHEDSQQWLPSLSAVQRLARNDESPRRPCLFKKGDKVFHENWGEGIVISNPEPAYRNTYAMDVFLLNNRCKPEYHRNAFGIKRIKQGALKKI